MNYAIFLPTSILVLYTLFMTPFMTLARFKAAKAGRVNAKYYKTYQGEGEPADVAVKSRHYNNLLEMPILFYLWAVIVFVTGSTDTVMMTYAWLYVGLRGLHGFIHLGSNKILYRMRVFALSWLTLLIAWLTLVYRLFLS